MSRIKKVLSVLSVLLITGQTWALEIDLSKIKVTGSLDLKGQAANNEADFVDNDATPDNRSITRHRISLGVGGELTDGVSTWVEAVRKPTVTVGTFGTGTQNVQTEQTNLVIENAHMSMEDVIWGVNAKVGRMYWGSQSNLVGYAGHYDDDILSVNGIDGVTLNRKFGNFDVNYGQFTLADTKATVGGVDAAGRTYVKSLGASANLKDLSGNDMADIPVALTIHHATNDGATQQATDNTNLGVYELNVGANLMESALKLGFDWGSNFGQRHAAPVGTQNAKTKFKGTLMALRGMYNHEESGFGFAAEIANSSGDDDARAPTGATQTDVDDKSWHDLSGIASATDNMRPFKHYGEILGKSNIIGGGAAPLLQGLNSGSATTDNGLGSGQGRGFNVMALGVTYKPAAMDKKWTLGADYITAKSNKVRPTTSTASTGATASLLDVAGDGSALSKDIGDEIDLHATYAKSENVSFKVGYAQFDPEAKSAALGTGLVTDKVTKFFANAGVRF